MAVNTINLTGVFDEFKLEIGKQSVINNLNLLINYGYRISIGKHKGLSFVEFINEFLWYKSKLDNIV